MELAVINSRAGLGINAPVVSVEVHLSAGLPAMSIVGLPETAVKESKDRVRSAIINSGLSFPARRITINLAPADLPKRDGGRFDLPIALGILVASRQLPAKQLVEYELAGELALDGSLRRFSGALPFALAAYRAGHTLILPLANAEEAALVRRAKLLTPSHLLEVCAHLNGSRCLSPYQPAPNPVKVENERLDLKDVYGQEQAKRALEIAAAGRHSLLMVGPPGVGKTMIAQRLPTILPELDEDEALDVAAIRSVSGQPIVQDWKIRPFRSPHHTASSVALVGGSTPPRPGEISLAHHGVLFLDELLEFRREVLESLREPLESGLITIARAAHHVQFPAKFQLITAMNPCPCGKLGGAEGDCNCTADQIRRYWTRISSPFLDRIDLWVSLTSLSRNNLVGRGGGEGSAVVRSRVVAARQLAQQRAGKANAELNNQELAKFCAISAAEQEYLSQVVERLKLSARSYHRIIRVARTIADLEQQETIQRRHLQEAVGYRQSVRR